MTYSKCINVFWLENPCFFSNNLCKYSVTITHKRQNSLPVYSLQYLAKCWYLSAHIAEKAMAAHSSVLAWRIPGTGEPGGLLSMGSHRVGHDWSDLAAACNRCKEIHNSTLLCFFSYTFLFSNWSIVNLQCCFSFRSIAKWFSYTFYIYIYIYIHTHIYFFIRSFLPYRLSQNIEDSSLCYTVGPCLLLILYVLVLSILTLLPLVNISLFPMPVSLFVL